MRIYSGSGKGRRLHAEKHRGLRPTSDKVKEALFNILASRVEGASFLDLFAGTGNIGIEAISRGARQCVFVEKSPAAVCMIEKNLARAGMNAILLPLDVHSAIGRLAQLGMTFNLVFLDPPYDRGLIPSTFFSAMRSGILAPGAIIVAEHSIREEPMVELAPMRSYRYGDTCLSVWRISE